MLTSIKIINYAYYHNIFFGANSNKPNFIDEPKSILFPVLSSILALRLIRL